MTTNDAVQEGQPKPLWVGRSCKCRREGGMYYPCVSHVGYSDKDMMEHVLVTSCPPARD